jgi:hypothetical protein
MRRRRQFALHRIVIREVDRAAASRPRDMPALPAQSLRKCLPGVAEPEDEQPAYFAPGPS